MKITQFSKYLMTGVLTSLLSLALISCDDSGSSSSGSDQPVEPGNPVDPVDPVDPPAIIPEQLTIGSEIEYLDEADSLIVGADENAVWNGVSVLYLYSANPSGWVVNIDNLLDEADYLNLVKQLAEDEDSNLFKIITAYLDENPDATGVNLGRDLPEEDVRLILDELNGLVGGRMVYITDSGHAQYPNEIELETSNVDSAAGGNLTGATQSNALGRVLLFGNTGDGFRVGYSLNAISSDNLINGSDTVLNLAAAN